MFDSYRGQITFFSMTEHFKPEDSIDAEKTKQQEASEQRLAQILTTIGHNPEITREDAVELLKDVSAQVTSHNEQFAHKFNEEDAFYAPNFAKTDLRIGDVVYKVSLGKDAYSNRIVLITSPMDLIAEVEKK